ncbi:MAG: polyphenol oxidase family protein [Candidatus Uhrbacteria bacterium]
MNDIWQSELLSKQDWLVHGTATLAFGSTRYPNADEIDANVENRATFLCELGLDTSRLVVSENVHGKIVATVDPVLLFRVSPPHREEGSGVVVARVNDCDGLVTSLPNIPIAIKTADCLPIFIADPTTRTVAIVHAGWKGVAAGIAIEAVRVMTLNHQPRALVVAIGPSIGSCHYAIHDERRDEMIAKTPFVSLDDFSDGRVDLRAIVVRQLVSSGVIAKNVDAFAPCTACHPDLLASYFLSQDASQGMLSTIAIRPTAD